MDGAADAELFHVGELHGLIADALAAEGRIPVEQHGHDLPFRFVGVAGVKLLGAGAPERYGVNRLQMGWVRLECEGRALPVRESLGVRSAQVVLHIARKGPISRLHDVHQLVEVVVCAFELGEHLHQGLTDHVREHVQPSSVRHADDDVCDSKIDRLRDGRVDAGDGRLPAVAAESLRGLVLGAEETFEGVDLAEALVYG
mmetsp:Transcript_85195/g.245936  ORF Transcript_85195/g.245936 Transcript_85195/m.245936 type:complete len:200 (+) Transcript_85195:1903-2502(+)